MRDSIGNRIEPGSLLLWHLDAEALKRGLVCTAVSVQEPQLVDGNGDTLATPVLVVQIPIHIKAPRDKEATLSEFLRIVNPQAEQAIENLMDGKRTLPAKAH